MTPPNATSFFPVRSSASEYSVWAEKWGEVPQGWETLATPMTYEESLDWIAGRWTSPFLQSAPEMPAQTSTPVSPPASTKSIRSRALAVPFPLPEATLRLIVFPHAGSGSSYYHFLAKAMAATLCETAVVAYPGREMRIREKPSGDLFEMISLLWPDMESAFFDKPYAFVGHSMGALIAFEFARELARRGMPGPTFMLCSGRHAPNLRGEILEVEGLSDDAFMSAVVERYNAIPKELTETPELLELILPALRSDFAIVAGYHYVPGPVLPCPIFLANGTEDPWVSDHSLSGWETETSQLRSRWFPGGHFFMKENTEAIIDFLRTEGCIGASTT